jgi:hypothetical protein
MDGQVGRMSRLSPGVILEALREAVTIVEPGEILAVRIDGRCLSGGDLDRMCDFGRQVKADHGLTVLFVAGEEFARIKAAGGVAP